LAVTKITAIFLSFLNPTYIPCILSLFIWCTESFQRLSQKGKLRTKKIAPEAGLAGLYGKHLKENRQPFCTKMGSPRATKKPRMDIFWKFSTKKTEKVCLIQTL